MRDSWTEKAIRSGSAPIRTQIEQKAAGCEGKQRFETWSAATKIVRRRRKGAPAFQTYRCTHCRGFHLGEPSEV